MSFFMDYAWHRTLCKFKVYKCSFDDFILHIVWKWPRGTRPCTLWAPGWALPPETLPCLTEAAPGDPSGVSLPSGFALGLQSWGRSAFSSPSSSPIKDLSGIPITWSGEIIIAGISSFTLGVLYFSCRLSFLPSFLRTPDRYLHLMLYFINLSCTYPPVMLWLIIRNIYILSLCPDFQHRARKILGISQVLRMINISFFVLRRWLLESRPQGGGRLPGEPITGPESPSFQSHPLPWGRWGG